MAASVTFPGTASNYATFDSLNWNNDWTCLAWVYSSSGTSSKSIVGNSGTSFAQLHLSGNNTPHAENQFNDGSDVEAVQTANFTTGKWWFLASTHDATGKEITLCSGDKSTNIVEDDSTVYTGTAAAGSSGTVVGELGTLGWFWDGEMSNLMVFERVLSVPEMQELQWNSSGISGSKIWSPFFDSSVLYDFSDNQSNGTITGSLSDSENGPPTYMWG